MRGKNLTERERYLIEGYLKAGLKVAEIAKLLGRARKTIYAEIKRGTITQIDTYLQKYTCYTADAGERKAKEAASNKGRPLKIGNDMEFVRFVEKQTLENKYSPYAISALIENQKIEFRTKVCWRTIYNYKNNGIFLNIKTHKKQKEKKRRVALNNKQCRSIEERPTEILERKEYGHWEMDTVVSGQGKGKACLLVLTERKTLEEIIRLMPDKKAESTKKALDKLEKELGAKQFRKKFKTITVDNGVEFLGQESLEKSIINKRLPRTTIYYCHPYSSWERGSNENQNKLIRKFYPKGHNLDLLTPQDAKNLEQWINNYPRKKFNGESPYTMLKKEAAS